VKDGRAAAGQTQHRLKAALPSRARRRRVTGTGAVLAREGQDRAGAVKPDSRGQLTGGNAEQDRARDSGAERWAVGKGVSHDL
jgi:hypothetical protein